VVNGDKTTKRVFRMLMFWNDEGEGRWLAEQARSGWRLKAVGCFRYTFEKVAPAEVAYRLDYGPTRFHDRSEYFGLFHDAGWEHVGTRWRWQYFRKAVVDGQVPEIHTDPQYRIAMYWRLIAVMLAIVGGGVVTPMAVRLSDVGLRPTLAGHLPLFVVQVLVVTLYAYGTVRLLLVIGRLKRNQRKQA
jgi:hypothetical protein